MNIIIIINQYFILISRRDAIKIELLNKRPFLSALNLQAKGKSICSATRGYGGRLKISSRQDKTQSNIPAWLLDSVSEFRLLHGQEAPMELLQKNRRLISIRFSGQIGRSCCAMDYFDDLRRLMETKAGHPLGIWEASLDVADASYTVQYVCLDFLDEIRKAMGEVRGLVGRRMGEFELAGRDGGSQFKELCFCVLTANYTAEGGARIQAEIGNGFSIL